MSGWIAGATVVSAGLGAYASNKASSAAADANQKAIDANAWQGKMAQDQYDDYKSIYQPLEKTMVDDAQNYDSPAAYNTAASEAQATVSSEMGKATDRLSRTVGYDPSSAAAQAASSNLALSGAALGATSQNTARLGVKNTAYAHKLDAIGLGKGLVTNASTGMAAAAAGARANSNMNYQQATDTAKGVGSLVSGVAGGLSKVDWSKFSKPSLGDDSIGAAGMSDVDHTAIYAANGYGGGV